LESRSEAEYQQEIPTCSKVDLLKTLHLVFFASILSLSKEPKPEVCDATEDQLENQS
jgi:hypothetical protein